MNKASLIIDFKNMIGPAGRGSEVDNQGILIWLNEAKDEVAQAILDSIPDYYSNTAVTALMANTVEHSLPNNFEKMIWVSVSYDGTNFVRALPLNNQGQADIQQNVSVNFSQAQPFYYISGNYIGIQPTSSSTIQDGLKINYAYLPKDMVEDKDEPDIPKSFHKLLKYWAYANYLDQNDEHVAAERMRQRFNANVSRKVDALADRIVDRSKTVEVYDDDQGLYLIDY